MRVVNEIPTDALNMMEEREQIRRNDPRILVFLIKIFFIFLIETY